MTSATTGTGTLTLAAAVSGYLTFAGAGVADQDVVLYGIKDGSNSEVGWGTYTASGTTLSRNVYKSTNSNALISCSGSEEIYITALGGDGGDLLPGSVNPMRGFDTPINLQLNASNDGTKLTIAVKGNNGSDPSNTNPVLIPFRDSTIASGDPVWVAVTSALSINTNAAGASLGTASSNVPFRLWVVAFNNAGTVVLALWQSVSGGATPTAVAALNEADVASSTAMSSSATAAATFYTPNGTTVSSKAFRILGYVNYASGLATAGTYASSPTTIQLFGPGIKKPNDEVQRVFYVNTSAYGGTTSSSFQTAFSTTITPTAAPNLLEVLAQSNIRDNSTADGGVGAVFNTTQSKQVGSSNEIYGTATLIGPWCAGGLNAPGSTAAQTIACQVKSLGGGTVYLSPGIGAETNLGTLLIKEIQV